MALPARILAVCAARFTRFCALCLLLLVCARAQQAPFVAITGPGAPKGCFFMFQDSHGAMWLAGCETGDEGFFYFDGRRFFSPLKSAFPHVIVRGMAEDTDGGIWLASSGGIFRFYQGRLEKMVDGLALAGITKVAPDVFLATVASSGSDPLQAAQVIRISRAQTGWQPEALLRDVPQVQFRLDPSGHVLYGCAGGYCELQAADLVHWRPGLELAITHHRLVTRTSYAQGASVVMRDRFGCVWLRGGIDASYQCTGQPHPVTLPASVASLGFPALLEGEDGSIVVPSYGRLAVGRPGTFQVLTAQNGYPSTGVALIARDGDIWLSNANGLFVLPRLRLEFWSARDGLELNVWSVLRMGDKVFAIAGDQIRVLSADRTRWRPLAKLDAATHLIAGPDGTLLAGSRTQGVLQINAQGKILRRSAPFDAAMLARTPDGRFWAAGAGVSRLVIRGRRLELEPVWRAPPMEAGGDMKVAADGSLWACQARGLGHLHSGSWRVLAAQEGLSQSPCDSFAMDANGDIWYDGGSSTLTLIQNPGSHKPLVQQFHSSEGLGTASSHFFNMDRRGWLWRGGADGLYVADLEQAHQGHWLHLDRWDGLPALDTNQKSFFEDVDGSIWFGVEGAVTHLFPPGDLLHPQYAPSVFVSAFSWDGGTPQTANLTQQIKSGADLTVDIGSLQLDRRNALSLRYRLLPEQASWTTTRAMDIHLGRLRWGQHTLEVQARLGSGPWSATVQHSLNVLKPFWLTWPVLAAFGGFSITAGGLGRLWWKRRATRIQKALPELSDWRMAALVPEAYQLVGSVLDQRFKAASILGRGGFAVVLAGEDLQEHRPCAIKVFRNEVAEDDWFLRRIQQEIAALQAVQHDNVVRIYGHGRTAAGAPYLAMEFIEGKTLRDLLATGPLPTVRVAGLLRQAGSALQALHSCGIYHRDLKPENIMLRAGESGERELVLIDFSIALVQEPDRTLHGLSRAAGTVHYMAPEQVVGHAGPFSDVYSLAKIIIEMLTGKPLAVLLPEASMDLPACVRGLIRDLGLDLPAGAVDLLSSALEFDPARRPQNAKEFADGIAETIAGTLSC